MLAVNLNTKCAISNTVSIVDVKLNLRSHGIPTGPQFNTVMLLAPLRIHILIIMLRDEVYLFYSSFQTWILSASQSKSRHSNKKTITLTTLACMHGHRRSCELLWRYTIALTTSCCSIPHYDVCLLQIAPNSGVCVCVCVNYGPQQQKPLGALAD